MAIKPVEIEIRAKDKASPAIKGVAQEVERIAPAARTAGAESATSFDGMYRKGLRAADGVKSISEQLALIQKAFVLFQGGGFLTGLIKDAAATADEYNNLAARIKLATGEGTAFEEAMAAVAEISLRTNSSLEATGNLFAKLTTAGKDAGLNAQQAQAQALALTESINQAVQVSGASAQASDAALTQLIQGLQGGVLRGDEFNSVMEQSPRLAKAMADGLGVTTGELRKMANEGQLTSQVVIDSLKSQSDTLKREFETLPPTVGRAVQNLATSWTVYVGETDKATGASELAARAVNALAENLDTVAGYLVDAGQAAAAFAALRLAQTFLGIGAAATVSATAIAANTAAMTTANVSAGALAANAGRFVTILKGLRTFTLLGLLTNIKDIGTFLGEGIAKLQGYKDGTEELEKAERSRVAVAEEQRRVVEQQAAAMKLAADRQFELSASANAALASFDALVKGGKNAAEAVADIGKDFDLSTQPGIANAAAVLDKLAADGKLSASQFQQAWADALKGEDLVAFEVKARAAIGGTARETERLAAIMDASLREAIRRSGADFDVLAGGMSKAARSAINDTDTIVAGLEGLRKQGIDVGKALEASLGKGIKTADSQASIDALRSRIEELRTTLGDKVADGLLAQIEAQALKVAGALGGVEGALKRLGITSDVELKKAAEETRALYDEVVKTGGSAREQAQAFEKMARAAIESGDAAAIAFAKSQAAARGFEITTDAAGKAIVRSMEEARVATDGVAESANKAAGGYRNMASSASEAAAAAERLAAANAKYASPLGAGKYSSPLENKYGSPRTGQSNYGNTREERLAGQGASDETLRFALLDKLNKGQLSEADVADLKNVVGTLRENQKMFDSLGIGTADNATLADDRKWQAIQARFEQAIATLEGGSSSRPGTAAVGRTVNVNINTSAGPRKVPTSEAGAAELVAALREAGISAGR